jgi:hypothetical protein
VYFQIDGNAVKILAVMHGSRDPRQWQSRL